MSKCQLKKQVVSTRCLDKSTKCKRDLNEEIHPQYITVSARVPAVNVTTGKLHIDLG
jgi:hypothetical protein